MQETGTGIRRATRPGEANAGQYTGGHGQGSIRTRVRVWRSACREDAFAAADAATTSAPTRPAGAPERSAQTDRVAEKVVQTQRTVVATKQHAEGWGGRCGPGGTVFERGVAAGNGLVLRADCDVPGAGGMEGTGGLAFAAGVACGGEVLCAGGGVCGFAYFSVSNFVRAWLRERR